MFTAFIIKFFFNNIFYQISHYFLKIIYKKKIKFFMKKIYPVLFHKFEKEIPNSYFQDFNWLMNDVGNYNLQKINSDLGYKELSMGMSNDYLNAIEFKSSFLRIGSKIFGART